MLNEQRQGQKGPCLFCCLNRFSLLLHSLRKGNLGGGEIPLIKKSSKVDSTNKNKHYSVDFEKGFADKIGGKIQISILDQQVMNELYFLV